MRQLEIIDACYRIDLRPSAWGELLCTIGARCLGAGVNTFCHGYELTAHGSVAVRWLAANDGVPALRCERTVSTFYDRLNLAAGKPSLADLFGITRPVVRVSSELDPEFAAMSQLLLPHWEWCGVFASLSGTSGVLLGCVSGSPLRLSARKRELWADVGGHLAVAHELRSLLPVTRLVARIAAALAPGAEARSGDLETSRATSDSERMIDLARSMDRWRASRRQRSRAEALELFRAVKSSEYALLETVDRGHHRTVVALRRPGGTRLTPRETAVCHFAADGLSNKLIGAELGISASTVAVHLSTALRKLGCPNRAALVLRQRHARLR